MKTNIYQDNEDVFFTVCNDEGKEVKCERLFIYEDNATGKNYIVYTDNTVDEEGNTRVYANQFDPSGEGSALLPIEEESVWVEIEERLAALQEVCNNGNKFKGALENLINELSEMLPQHKTVFESIMANPDPIGCCALIDGILKEEMDCFEEL